MDHLGPIFLDFYYIILMLYYIIIIMPNNIT